MKCHHCNKHIDKNTQRIFIEMTTEIGTRTWDADYIISFHTMCFKEVAGEQYFNAVSGQDAYIRQQQQMEHATKNAEWFAAPNPPGTNK